jgi:hypothetical protein
LCKQPNRTASSFQPGLDGGSASLEWPRTAGCNNMPQGGTKSHQQHTTMMCGMVDQNGHQQTAKSEATHCLVQELAICQRMLEPSPANILTHGAGENNTPKAIASRAITQIGDDDTAFVMHLDTLFSSQGGLTLV